MWLPENCPKEALPDVALCHAACFPGSLAARLGKGYVQKTLEWFLVHPNRFLFHVLKEGKVVGYCGGFVPVKNGDGSSSGMFQHAFYLAIRGIIRHPSLLFHPEVRPYYPFVWLNIKRKLTGRVIPAKVMHPAPVFKPFTGLVVIGVHPHFRGTGVAQALLAGFEKRAGVFGQNEVVLSVKKDNARAIKAYTNNGWKIREEHTQTFVMNKFIVSPNAL